MTLSTGPKARLMLRYPDGQREQIALSAKSKLMVGIAFVFIYLFWTYELFIYDKCWNFYCGKTRQDKQISLLTFSNNKKIIQE